ncbi:MAG TPA: hypothetical protein ENJ62_06025, partial [Bryobacterales bacterium]|nr:hypothetical protein [Bryobacterales bacterium]
RGQPPSQPLPRLAHRQHARGALQDRDPFRPHRPDARRLRAALQTPRHPAQARRHFRPRRRRPLRRAAERRPPLPRRGRPQRLAPLGALHGGGSARCLTRSGSSASSP